MEQKKLYSCDTCRAKNFCFSRHANVVGEKLREGYSIEGMKLTEMVWLTVVTKTNILGVISTVLNQSCPYRPSALESANNN